MTVRRPKFPDTVRRFGRPARCVLPGGKEVRHVEYGPDIIG